MGSALFSLSLVSRTARSIYIKISREIWIAASETRASRAAKSPRSHERARRVIQFDFLFTRARTRLVEEIIKCNSFQITMHAPNFSFVAKPSMLLCHFSRLSTHFTRIHTNSTMQQLHSPRGPWLRVCLLMRRSIVQTIVCGFGVWASIIGH